ncbi:MAG: hypothetical protein WCH61_02395, partial [bacterium]
MKKLIAYLTILLFLPGVIGTGAEEKTGSKTGEPDPQYAQLVKADLVKEIQQRWEFMSLGSDTYQYELAQLTQQAKSNTASKKSKEKSAATLIGTQKFLSVEEIKDGLLFLKDGS